MALRPGDRKAHVILAAVIFAGFLLDGTWAVVRERSLARVELRQRALMLAALTKAPIATAYNNFFESGFYRFRGDVKDLLESQPNLKRIQIVDLQGRIRFDSDQTEPARASSLAPLLPDDRGGQLRMDAVRRLETTELPLTGASEDTGLDVVTPYLEEWGRHELSVIYHFRFGGSVGMATRRLLVAHLLPALAAALGTSVVVLALLRRVA